MSKTEEVKTEEVKSVSSVGSQYYSPIEYVYDEEVKFMVPKFGKQVNRYEMIQASKPSCDINYIVKRALAGDMTALNVKTPAYADISDTPDNLNDLHALNVEAINQFYKLDPNLRKDVFNNDVDAAIAAIGDGSFETKIYDYVKAQAAAKAASNESVGAE